jgi:hypothetical protein
VISSAGEYFGCFLRMAEAGNLSAATAESLLAEFDATGDARRTSAHDATATSIAAPTSR